MSALCCAFSDFLVFIYCFWIRDTDKSWPLRSLNETRQTFYTWHLGVRDGRQSNHFYGQQLKFPLGSLAIWGNFIIPMKTASLIWRSLQLKPHLLPWDPHQEVLLRWQPWKTIRTSPRWKWSPGELQMTLQPLSLSIPWPTGYFQQNKSKSPKPVHW